MWKCIEHQLRTTQTLTFTISFELQNKTARQQHRTSEIHSQKDSPIHLRTEMKPFSQVIINTVYELIWHST